MFSKGGGVRELVDNSNILYMNQNFGITCKYGAFFGYVFEKPFSIKTTASDTHGRSASLIETDRAFPAMSDKYHQWKIVSRKDERA